MTDRAAEIARAYRQSYLLNITLAVAAKMDGPLRGAVDAAEKQFAAALRSYGNERLEEAARELNRGGPNSNDDWSNWGAADFVRSLKSQPEQPDKDTGTGE